MHKHSGRLLPFLLPIMIAFDSNHKPKLQNKVKRRSPYFLTCKYCNCICLCIWGTSNHPISSSLLRSLHICKSRQSIHAFYIQIKKKDTIREKSKPVQKAFVTEFNGAGSLCPCCVLARSYQFHGFLPTLQMINR